MESKSLEASRFIASNSKETTKTQQHTQTTTTVTGCVSAFVNLNGNNWSLKSELVLWGITGELNRYLILGKICYNSEMTHEEGGVKKAELADEKRNGVNVLKNVFLREKKGKPGLWGLTLSQFYYCTSISCGSPRDIIHPVDSCCHHKHCEPLWRRKKIKKICNNDPNTMSVQSETDILAQR